MLLLAARSARRRVHRRSGRSPGGCALATESVAEPSPPAPTPAPPAAEPRRACRRRRRPRAVVGPDFTRIAGQAVKGVANISSVQVVARPRSPFDDDPFFSYFFGDQDVFGSRDRRSLSLGSGVIISADGYVVTNNHVVGENVREITVALADKREVRGKVIGTDPATDIALLKIDVARACRRCRGAIRASCRSASGCWPSAARFSSVRR